MITGSLSELWDFYRVVFREHAHQLLLWAHMDVRAQLDANLDEPDITGLLATAMTSRLNHLDTPDDYLHYTIGDQQPQSPGGELGNDRLRLDVTVIRSGIRPRLTFVYEAKRLRTSGFAIGKYVGEGGMGDFLSCRYAADAPEAAMVGLFQNRDLAYWHLELQRAFDEDRLANLDKLGIDSGLAPIIVLNALVGELESRHRRSNGTDIQLFHIFLDCRPEVGRLDEGGE